MTRFVTSAPYRPYTHVSQPQRVAMRQIMHGNIVPMNDNLVTMGKRINSTRIALGIGLFVVVVFGGEEVRAIAFGTVATRQSPLPLSQVQPRRSEVTISVQVSCNGDYKCPVSYKQGDREESFALSGRGKLGPDVRDISFYHGPDAMTLNVGPEEQDNGEAEAA